MSDFEALLKESGVPTTEEDITAEFKASVAESGSTISNDSLYSPFWRLISAVATKPVMWLVNAMIKNIMPQFFLKTVGESFINLWGDSYKVERKEAAILVGRVLFSRTDTTAEATIPAGTIVYTDAINNTIYQLATTDDITLAVGEDGVIAAVRAVSAGAGYNLETGYYRYCDIEGITVTNPVDWIDSVGADYEDIEDYRQRIRNAFNTLSHYHTDGVYRYLISKFAGVSTDMVWFEHEAPRGPGTANAYVLFELDAPADSYIATINRMISSEGYHGHGDDLKVFNMPETMHTLSATVYLPSNLLNAEKQTILTGVEQAIQAAFRSNSAYVMTQTLPFSRFSFTRMASEIYRLFPDIESLTFDQGDIVSEMSVPRLTSVSVVEGS
ncbi:baseplate J/gp47 family protein [Marinomonas arenicola]|uniref:baseplate J/gp47 family protein n=1 Tax=Marinomonas arenicola TaxID=569601 RepID=UPI00311DE2B4